MEEEIERILNMPDEQVLAEMRADGLDPDEESRNLATQFRVIADLVNKNDKLRGLLSESWRRHAAATRRDMAERKEIIGELQTVIARLNEARGGIAEAKRALRSYGETIEDLAGDE